MRHMRRRPCLVVGVLRPMPGNSALQQTAPGTHIGAPVTIPLYSRSHATAPDARFIHLFQQDCAYDQSITDAFFVAAVFKIPEHVVPAVTKALDDCRRR
jgi:hypothetical protein